MNSLQRLVLRLGAGLVLLVVLFPPWVYQATTGNSYSGLSFPGDYAPIFHPPSLRNASERFLRQMDLPVLSVRIDSPRLAFEIAGIALCTAGLFLSLRGREEKGNPSREVGGP
jgi:hypothetical protein